MHKTFGFIVGAIALATALNYLTTENFWWETTAKGDGQQTQQQAQFKFGPTAYSSAVEEAGEEKAQLVYECSYIPNADEGILKAILDECADDTTATMLPVLALIFAAISMVPLFTDNKMVPLFAAASAFATGITAIILLSDVQGMPDRIGKIETDEGVVIKLADTSITAAGVIDGVIIFTILPFAYAGVVAFELLRSNGGIMSM